ncbi:MAG: MATE family efflux transporter [Thermomicrobiales bacterium]
MSTVLSRRPGNPGPVEHVVDAGEIRRSVLGLAWPSILENFMQAALGFITTLMVARLGSAAVAGVGTASQVQVIVITAFFAVSMGTTVLIAHAFGAGRIDTEGDAIVKQSTIAGLILALVLTPLTVLLAAPVMRGLGAEPDVVSEGAKFLQITSLSFIFMAIMFILSGALRGVGDTRTSMVVTAFMNVINIALVYALVFGFLFIPELGVTGAALAMVFSRGVGAAIMWLLLWQGRRGLTISGRDGWKLNWQRLKRLADIGLPSMGESVLRSGGQIVFVIVVFMLGTAVTAGNQVAQNAMFLSMFPGFGFSMAATSLVGQSLGARNPERARKVGMTATRWCLAWMSAMGVIFFVFAHPIMEFAASGDDKAAIVTAGVDALRLIAFIQPPLAIGFVMAGILRGAGDTRFPMYSTSLTMWLLRVPLAYLFGVVFDWGLQGIYVAMMLDTVVLMVMNLWRYRQGDWMMRNLAGTEDDEEATPVATPISSRVEDAEPAPATVGR